MARRTVLIMLLIIASSSIATTLSLNLPATRTTTTIVLLKTSYAPLTPITNTVPTTTIMTTTTSPCPLSVVSVDVMSSKLTYYVGEHIIIYWSSFGGTANGILTLVGPSGTYPEPLNQNVMAAGTYDAGTTEAKDIGSWTATLTVLGPPGCPPVGEGSTQFKVVAF